jgi:hypothetical protein
LPGVFAEFFRVLAPDAPLLLGFHAGDDRRTMTLAYGHEVSCESYRLPPDHIAALLGEAGFDGAHPTAPCAGRAGQGSADQRSGSQIVRGSIAPRCAAIHTHCLIVLPYSARRGYG